MLNIIPINKLKNSIVSIIQGSVQNIRNKQNICFLVLKDITSKIQVTILKEKNKKFNELLQNLTLGSILTLTGVKKKNQNVKLNGCEFIPSNIVCESLAAINLPVDEKSLIDQRIDYRWIDLRSEKNQLIFKVQTKITTLFREWCNLQGFIEIHPPELIKTASESGSEVFEISNYFGSKAYLAQSPQFYKQMAIASGFEKVFVNAPVFRAEKSLTRKHATEFTGFDLEFNNVYSRFDVMIKEEQMLTYMLKKLYPFFSKQIEEEFSQSYKEQLRNDYNLLLNKYKNKNLAQDIKFLLENASVIYKNKPKLKEIRENNKKHGYKGLFPVLTLKQVYKELEKEYGYKVDEQEKGDINAEGEKFVYLLAMKKFGSEFMFIDGYGKENRPFYHARDKNNVPDGFDLIWRGVEITSGAKREHRYEILKQQANEKGLQKDVDFYLNFFKWGCVPHGGFGIGLDRLTMLLFNINIIEAQFVARTPNRLAP